MNLKKKNRSCNWLKCDIFLESPCADQTGRVGKVRNLGKVAKVGKVGKDQNSKKICKKKIKK